MGDGSSEGSGYCIANARSKATTSCFAIWCECFHHRASCMSSERYWKGCRRSRRGCPRVTTLPQDRAISLAHLRNRHVTATETALTTVGNRNRHIHPKTVRNRLREFGLRARRPYIGFPLTRPRRARRMAWLAAHGPRQFPMRQWRQIFYTDESWFTPFSPDGRRRGERFADACVHERDRFGGGSVMVWGGISHGLK